MLFVLGFIIFAVSLGIGVTRGDPNLFRNNRWHRVASIGVFIGGLLMAASPYIFIWGLLP
jgi:hypothetical protein